MIRLWFWLHRKVITSCIMIILFLLGSICVGAASCFLEMFYGAPVYSFKPGYSGFGIFHNDTIIPVSMIVSVVVNPAELWFDYFFGYNENGTYNFIFVFPFNILGFYRASENMSTRSTPHGSAVWLQYRASNTSLGYMNHQIWGDFKIENTFQEGTRGSYTIILPFGMGIEPDVASDLQKTLEVPLYSGDVNVTLYVTLPGGFMPTTTFPPNSAGPEPYTTPFNTTITSIEWNAGKLQNSVTIEAVDTGEKSFYDNIPFESGVLLAIGLQFMFTTSYDAIRKWGSSKTET